MSDLDLSAVRDQARQALGTVAGYVGGVEYLPSSVREHFEKAVPDLLAAVEHLAAEVAEVRAELAETFRKAGRLAAGSQQEGTDSRGNS